MKVKLKDVSVFARGGGMHFFLTSKCKISGLGYRMDFKLVSADAMDHSGPFGTMFGVFVW